MSDRRNAWHRLYDLSLERSLKGHAIRSLEGRDLVRVKALLSQGASPNAFGSQGDTALMIAALYGHSEIVRLLLKHGADPNAVSETGHNALGLTGCTTPQRVRFWCSLGLWNERGRNPAIVGQRYDPVERAR